MRSGKKQSGDWLDREKLRVALHDSWNRETAYPKDQEKWTDAIPSTGQCAATALVVQDRFGGALRYDSELNHYWISFPNGDTIDFTKDQFGEGVRA